MSSIKEKHILEALDHIEIAYNELNIWAGESLEELNIKYLLRLAKKKLGERIKDENHDRNSREYR